MSEKTIRKKAPEAEEDFRFSDVPPSEFREGFWVYARRRQGVYPPHTERSGKWMVFPRNEDHDAVWAEIRRATIEGKLGGQSKASSALPNPNQTDPDRQAIMVFTYDGDDVEDVGRIREELRALGHTQTLYWKPNGLTRAGIYSEGGRNRVWRYKD